SLTAGSCDCSFVIMTSAHRSPRPLLATLGLATLVCSAAHAQTAPPPILGRWDFTVTGSGGPYPSWLEVMSSGYSSLVGRFVGAGGSARPVGKVEYTA
ncbi:MAG: hypothetical protein ACT4P6_02970, partial [Gemmatimonadaceae bacterium]